MAAYGATPGVLQASEQYPPTAVGAISAAAARNCLHHRCLPTWFQAITSLEPVAIRRPSVKLV